MELSTPSSSGISGDKTASKAQEFVANVDKLSIQCRMLSERVAAHFHRHKTNTELMGAEAETMQQNIVDLQRQYEKLKDKSEAVAGYDSLQRAKQIFQGSGPGDDLRKLFRGGRNPLIIRLLLGKQVNLVAQDRRESIKIKEEYYSFRDSSGVQFVLFSSLLLAAHTWTNQRLLKGEPSFVPPIKVGLQAFLCWLLYFYVALSMRENVLCANGSQVRPWWIHHHYLSILMVVLMLVMPVDSPAVNEHCGPFLQWCVGQGVTFVLQNRYQRRRMYTRIALGKNSNMDVVAGESSGASGQLLSLLPFLFGLQALQMYVGYKVFQQTYHTILTPEGWLELEDHASDLRGSRGACVCGVLFMVMALGNFQATVYTLRNKRRYRREAAKRASERNDLDNRKAD